jgi:hypothetical protein
MNEILDRILSDRPAAVETRERVRNYIGLLASAGITNHQLIRYGKAYLQEMFKPDSRYTGC